MRGVRASTSDDFARGGVSTKSAWEGARRRDEGRIVVIADAGDASDARAREKAREFGEGTFEASFPMEGATTDAAKAMHAGGGPVCSPVVADREVCRDFLKVRLF